MIISNTGDSNITQYTKFVAISIVTSVGDERSESRSPWKHQFVHSCRRWSRNIIDCPSENEGDKTSMP